MILRSHGTAALRGGSALLEADYHAGDGEPGVLSLTLQDQETGKSVDGAIRLDPWFGDEYPLIEPGSGSCFLICGASAVVAVNASSLAWASSVGLEYQEGETLDLPWHAEVGDRRMLVAATERRVWCVDEHGAIRWLWSCSTSDIDRWISGPPVVASGEVCVPLRTRQTDRVVKLRLEDGLPTRG